jgi:hypothetical protein
MREDSVEEIEKKWVSLLHRVATTNYPCCCQALGDLKGADRVGLTRRKSTTFSPIFKKGFGKIE